MCPPPLLVVLWASIAVMRPFRWRDYLPVPALGLGAYGSRVVLTGLYAAGKLAPRGHDVGRSIARDGAGLLHDRIAPALVVLVAAPATVLFARLYGRSIMRERTPVPPISRSRSPWPCCSVCNGCWRPMPTVLLACPMAILLAYPLQTARRTWLAELAVYALLAVALASQWAG
ncbi:MAG: hypothetical protein IPK99_17890 [Flavobacteriales bacterium]|nr:hypothetical protein [Flavobacteriales bacterium]